MSWKYLFDVFLGKITSEESKTLTDLSEYKLWFGKYRSQSLESVWNADPSYLLWFMNEKTTTCKMTQTRVREFVSLMGKVDHEVVAKQALHLKYLQERKELQDHGYLQRNASKIRSEKQQTMTAAKPASKKPTLKPSAKVSRKARPSLTKSNIRQLTLAR